MILCYLGYLHGGGGGLTGAHTVNVNKETEMNIAMIKKAGLFRSWLDIHLVKWEIKQGKNIVDIKPLTAPILQ